MGKLNAANILHRAESEIADLATKAAKERDYTQAEQLLVVAKQLAGMAARLGGGTTAPAPEAHEKPTRTAPVASDMSPAIEDEDAPTFEKEGNELIKTGQSKEGNVYEHKAPRQTIDLLLQAVSQKVTKQGEFRTSRIFPLLDSDGRKLPAYQGYLCLRWLRQIGLVHRIGRQRYQLLNAPEAESKIEAAWQSLRERGA